MQQPQQPVQKKQTMHWFWWILAVGLLVWNVLSFLPKSKPEINIPYSQFISQVNAGNIANIQVSGSEITGKFVNPFPGPLPTLAPSQTVSPNATPVSPTLYNAFVTTFPDTQGDPNFMSLLEKNNVVVNVSQPPNPIISLLLSSVLPILKAAFIGTTHIVILGSHGVDRAEDRNGPIWHHQYWTQQGTGIQYGPTQGHF